MASKPTLGELKAQHGAAFEELVFGLFRPTKHQVFVAGDLPAELIAEFAQCDEAFGAALEFAHRLKVIWAARYPDQPALKPLVPPVIQPMPLTVFDAPAAQQEKIAMTDKPEPAPAPLKPGQIPAASAAAVPLVLLPMKTHFNLPNCRVGVPYSAQITGRDALSSPLVITDMEIPPDIGLMFDPETQLVTGAPRMDGEFELALHWRYDGSTARNPGRCHLIVNPDPRSLWKLIEPAAGQAYPKAHLDHGLIEAGGLRLLAASRRGRSHEHGGTFRDDDFFLDHDAASGWSVMLVADGAGSAKHSREGSRLAVQAAGAHVAAQLKGEFGQRMAPMVAGWDSAAAQEAGSEFHYLFHTAASAAVQAIEQEAERGGAAVRDYATTLLAVVSRRAGDATFIASFWMGDGAIAAYGPRGTVKLMGTPDSGEFAGQTRFLDRAAISDPGFGKRVRIGRLADVSAVIAMTDGVSDPYFETDNGLADPAKWDGLWDELQPHLRAGDPAQRVLEWLHFFRQGHHDDRTIAILW